MCLVTIGFELNNAKCFPAKYSSSCQHMEILCSVFRHVASFVSSFLFLFLLSCTMKEVSVEPKNCRMKEVDEKFDFWLSWHLDQWCPGLQHALNVCNRFNRNEKRKRHIGKEEQQRDFIADGITTEWFQYSWWITKHGYAGQWISGHLKQLCVKCSIN